MDLERQTSTTSEPQPPEPVSHREPSSIGEPSSLREACTAALLLVCRLTNALHVQKMYNLGKQESDEIALRWAAQCLSDASA